MDRPTDDDSSMQGFSNRGARIRTGDLTDPNGARYQAAPRPDAAASIHTAPPRRRSWLSPLTVARRHVGRAPRRASRPTGPRAGALRRLLRQRPAGARAGAGRDDRHGRLRARGAVRAGGRRGRGTAARPPRAVLGLGRARRSTPRSSAACRSCSRATSRSPPTTCPWTPIRSSATTRCWPPLWARRELEPFALHRGQPIGFLASLRGDGLAAGELFARVHEITAREPLVFDFGPRADAPSGDRLRRGRRLRRRGRRAGADALLTGEPAERSMASAREAGVHLIAAGHYATETFGVRRLGEHLAERFGLQPRVPGRAQPRVRPPRAGPRRDPRPRQLSKLSVSV